MVCWLLISMIISLIEAILFILITEVRGANLLIDGTKHLAYWLVTAPLNILSYIAFVVFSRYSRNLQRKNREPGQASESFFFLVIFGIQQVTNIFSLAVNYTSSPTMLAMGPLFCFFLPYSLKNFRRYRIMI